MDDIKRIGFKCTRCGYVMKERGICPRCGTIAQCDMTCTGNCFNCQEKQKKIDKNRH